ncbi:MAG TPA: carboxypeptidase regulatory-like domain-containing protein [Thermoplasmata archaeon]|nr:carboxypeptidase regulatory-like domain-containing protein [Thermoplasmata archaeon]
MRARTAVLVAVLLCSIVALSAPPAAAADVVNRISLLADSFVNGSEVFVLAILNFTTGPPPDPSLVDPVDFAWYAPNGTLAFTESVDPDALGFAVTSYVAAVVGAWRVNATYSTNTSVTGSGLVEVLPEVWTAGNHVFAGNVEVGPLAALTIDPGAVVRFDPGAGLTPGGGLTVRGRLTAAGTAANPITLTSNNTAPAAGDWRGLRFTNASSPSSVVDYLQVRYAARGVSLEAIDLNVTHGDLRYNLQGVRLVASAANVTDSHFEANSEGITAIASPALLTRNTFIANVVAINLEGNASVRVEASAVDGSTAQGIWAEGAIGFTLANLTLRGNAVGLRLDDAAGTATGLLLDGGSDGITASGGTVFTLANSTVANASVRAFFLQGSAQVEALNVALVPANAAISVAPASTARLTVRNFLTVRAVSYENGSALVNVSVQVYDDMALVASVFTGPTGETPPAVVTDRVYRPGAVDNVLTRIDLQRSGFAFENDDVSTWDMAASATLIFRGSVADNDADGAPDFADTDDDNDGLSDITEGLIGTDPLDPDSDADGMPDAWEFANGLGPTNATDAAVDLDVDLLSNLAEWENGTDPQRADTDLDVMPDGWELLNGFDPLSSTDGAQDADGDGHSNVREYLFGTDPRDPLSFPPPAPGSIEGTVRGIYGTPLAGARVELGAEAALTDASGHFVFDNVTAGTYAATISLAGFVNRTVANIPVLSGEVTTLAVILQRAPGTTNGTNGSDGNQTRPRDPFQGYVFYWWAGPLFVAVFTAVAVAVIVWRQRVDEARRERLRQRRRAQAKPAKRDPEEGKTKSEGDAERPR